MNDLVTTVEKNLDISSVIDEVHQMLDRAETFEDTIKVRQTADVLKIMASKSKLSEAAQELAKIKLEAERKAGKQLKTIIKKGPNKKFPEGTYSLDDLGINKKESMKWQWIASIPEYAFQHYLSSTNNATTQNAYQKAKLYASFRDIAKDMEPNERNALVKKAILEGFDERQFRALLFGEQEEEDDDEFNYEEEEDSFDLTISQEVNENLISAQRLHEKINTFEKVIQTADVITSDDYKMLVTGVKLFKDAVQRLVLLVKEVESRIGQ